MVILGHKDTFNILSHTNTAGALINSGLGTCGGLVCNLLTIHSPSGPSQYADTQAGLILLPGTVTLDVKHGFPVQLLMSDSCFNKIKMTEMLKGETDNFRYLL